jgi:hypothetical protein
MSPKSAIDFINDVIIPIEQNNVESGNLYVLFRSRPNLSTYEYEETSNTIDNAEEWSFPSVSGPGEWIKPKEVQWIEDNCIKLETLSGIVWRGVEGGRLYKAVFEGDCKRIGPREYWGGTSGRAKIDVEAKQYIDECISLGLEVKSARLISIIKNWKPYLLWSFALDCVERAYSFNRQLASDVYKGGIIFARAYSKYMCGIGGIELESFVKGSSDDKNFYALSLNKKYELERLISGQSELGASVYLRKALVEALDPFKPFQVANYARTAIASHDLGKYHENYEYPGFAVSNLEDYKMFSRIWVALQKKELDWQVEHLSILLGN